MNTLVEFMTRTKGIEYLISVGSLFAFVAFWWLLHHRGKGLGRKILVPTACTLGAAAVVWLGVTSTPTESKPVVAHDLLSSAVLTSLYGPATWNHEAHKALVGDCKTCHHNSGAVSDKAGEQPPPCTKCHGGPEAKPALGKPGLAHVYHLRCIGCHKASQVGPTTCAGCHKKAAVPPLSMAHPATGQEACLSCHGPHGMAGVTKIRPDHQGVPETVCRLCHKPVEPEKGAAK